MKTECLKGIILDYGGTIDTPGIHWSHIIQEGYNSNGASLTREEFWPVYCAVEREMARQRHILPGDNFYETIRKKAALQISLFRQNGLEFAMSDTQLAEKVAAYCNSFAQGSINSVRGTLKKLAETYPLALVSNFYGNIQSVLLGFGIIDYFNSVIESSTIGVRKPDPRIFAIGCQALGYEPESVLVVGDTIEKDILPASSIGCHTVWLRSANQECPPQYAAKISCIPQIQELNGLHPLLFGK